MPLNAYSVNCDIQDVTSCGKLHYASDIHQCYPILKLLKFDLFKRYNTPNGKSTSFVVYLKIVYWISSQSKAKLKYHTE